MAKYIDAEKLIAEIDDILSACTKQTHTGVYNTCHRIKGIITSLQQEQPEVDLEKEIDDELDRNWRGYYIERRRFVESVKYFYNLGLNARKEESK